MVSRVISPDFVGTGISDTISYDVFQAPDKKGTAKLVKSLSDKEYEDIFTAVLKCTSAKNLG